jgi:hypothetical protein
MSSKESLEELTHSEYWDKRYEETAATEEKYDWLRNFEAIKPFLIKYLPPATKDPSLLQLGCGNSVRSGISITAVLHRANRMADSDTRCIPSRLQEPSIY